MMYTKEQVLEYVEFCIRCDRMQLSLLNIEDYFKSKEWYNEEKTTERMNIIGQNGNNGDHYENNKEK